MKYQVCADGFVEYEFDTYEEARKQYEEEVKYEERFRYKRHWYISEVDE